ncbi:T9SS type A sorting domain-containing protein [Tamlana sp. I1]|uniref:pectate lyase family protein n=1 Tax=Tamlana sp. I1 TaxID=2762061 RepID=UPI00188E4F00|nr:T9SS type A sorting domain-containing protein [Tamlana sp. I1]
MLKKVLFLATILLLSFVATAQDVTISESEGWLESAFVKWTPVNGADSYNVYYSGEGVTNKKIDNQLIRCYNGYNRADILGLKAGTYTISVAAVVSGTEGPKTTTSNITVLEQDRTGFAFSNGRVPGAYKADGTPKDNAVILYITENSKNTVSLNVTGATSNPCVGLQTILEGFKKGNDTRPLIIRLIGQITDFDYMLNGDIVIENKNNAASYITLEGVGDDATADGWGIRIKNASNIEIRNIGSMNVDSGEGDNIGLQQDNDYIWVHNVDFFYGGAGGDSDQAKGDGALDCKKSTYVTFSYNHFWDSGKCNLLGLSEDPNDDLYITYHHNWYDHSDSRHPRVRFYSAHVYNNYYDGNSKYGIGATEGSSVFSEGNYFRNCKYPMLTSMQGSDVYDESKAANDYSDMPTFSKEDGGTIKAFNNYIETPRRFVAYGDTNFPSPTADFDAYVVSNRNDQVPSSVTSAYGANTYDNFDTDNAIMYSYTPDSPTEARDKVMQYAGRVKGGDFKWTFDNAVDDTSYDVNPALKAALTSYTTTLVCTQGEAPPTPEVALTAYPGDGLVELNWTVTNFNATSYEVYRDTDSDPAGRTKLSTITDANTLTYTDNTVTNETEYFYWIVADSAVESDAVSATPSNIAPPPPASSDEIHNFTTSGVASTFYTITGNLSTSKGTVTYNELTLTQCLKMESATSITFNTSAVATLTLVFNEGETRRVKINGTTYNAVNGVLEIELTAGAQEITKGDSMNLYYMSVEYDTLNIEDKETTQLKVYPNPVSDIVYINSVSKVEKVEIYSIQGALVLKTANTNIKEVNMSQLKTGTYLIKIYTNSGVTDKILIKR